jgi:hypothetical protein
MSVVSGVTLQISVGEQSIEQDDGSDVFLNITKINEWLGERHFGPLVSVEDHYGGSKHPQVAVFGAGYNHFMPRDEFIGLVESRQRGAAHQSGRRADNDF